MLLSVNGVSKSFGVDTILEDISFRVDRRDRIALVGRNGCGKTTLLRLLMELEEPDSGTIQFARGIRVSALKQEAQVSKGKTVLQEAEMARSEQLALKQRLLFLEQRLEDEPTDEELEEYATLHEHFLELEGYRAENDVRVVLQKMGFLEEDFSKPTSKLSGGEKTRLALARLLLEEPDLLILDEPTNHLDLQATEWLEGWIKTYPGAIVVVSHDRTFLESGFDRFLEIRNCRMHAYPGPLSKYLKVKDEEADRIAEVAKRQQDQIDKLDEYVRRFMGTQRTAQARGRRTLMEKLTANKVVVERKDATMVGGYTAGKRSGDIVLECKGISKQFGDQPLLKDVDWAVRIGERWGVIGENGAGKSTLIKCALGLVEPTAGTAKLGANVDVGYFAQDVSELNLDQSPLDHLVYNFDIKPPEARHLLGRFLFYGDDVFRPIRTMSGGEKNKLVLASLTVLKPNLLILDEPTNHLDMDSRQALASVLKDYKGTLVLISHDRWLLSQLTDNILDVRRGSTIQYPGSYAEYRRSQLKKGGKSRKEEAKPEATTTFSPREVSKEISRRKVEIHEIEAKIAKAEARVKAIEIELGQVPAPKNLLELTKEHQAKQNEMERMLTIWAHESEALEELVNSQGV